MLEREDFADELGPVKVIEVRQPALGLQGILVIDNVAAGPAIGGLRMAPDVSLRECARLARAMTLKNAAAGLPHGGAKSVLVGDPRMPRADKERLIRAFACALREQREYIFGPDMGTDEGCMAWVHDEIGRAVGLPRALGGIPLDEMGATAWGLSHAIEVAVDDQLDFELAGARLVVQGFGAVGSHLARFLAAKGVKLVGVSDSRGTLADPGGLDLTALLALKAAGRSVVDYEGGVKGGAAAVVGIACDIWVPAARPDVVHKGNVADLDTRLVAQGANIPLTGDAEAALQRRGILNLPDFIANAGGVICGALEYQHLGQAVAFETIEQTLRSNTRQMLQRARTDGCTPRQAALAMASERVRTAMQGRRWGLY